MPHWGWQASGPTNFFFSIYDRRPTNRGGDLSENYRRATCCNFSGEGNQRDTNTSPRRIPVQAIRKYPIWRRLMRAAGAVPIPLPKKAAFYQAPAERLAPDDCGQDGDNDNDVCRPSSSCYYHPPHPWRTHPPRPSPASPVGGGCAPAAATTRTTWWCCTGGGWASATPMPMAPMRWWGGW